ncbi:tripartite ATP-independent transporter DctM subunit [Sporosarcina sp. JAI121]|nr:TRAP transporter large permease [Sporosarcina sp. JAI121]NYF25632.1 tripartite ATP-independent transporter DctM subunit [Sporosarcina sp. JAI121]
MSIAVSAGLLILFTIVALLLLGIPIGITLIVASILAITQALGFSAAIPSSALKMFQGINIFTLMAIPFFILAGNIMNKGGIAVRLINLATAMTGRIPGSLAHTNVVANMLFGSISGSGTAAVSAMGSIMSPIQKKEGYDENFTAAINIATAPTGLLIPPSTALITYALASGGTSVAALFLGGIIPGVLWGISCMVVAFFYAKKRGYVGKQSISINEFVKVTLDAIPSLLLIIIVIGGIVGGIFTATEGSAIAVVYSLLLSILLYKTITLKELYTILIDSAKLSAIIMFLIGASNIMAWVMSFTGIPNMMADVILGISDNPIIILLAINILLLFVGTFMDLTPAILIFTPILLPVCLALGMTPLHFGIMLTFNLCIGTITPPVGNILFAGVKVSGRKLEHVMPQLLRFYVSIFVVLLLVTYVPWFSTFLPSLAGYR